jgi:hypothetical protein
MGHDHEEHATQEAPAPLSIKDITQKIYNKRISEKENITWDVSKVVKNMNVYEIAMIPSLGLLTGMGGYIYGEILTNSACMFLHSFRQTY